MVQHMVSDAGSKPVSMLVITEGQTGVAFHQCDYTNAGVSWTPCLPSLAGGPSRSATSLRAD